MSRATDVPTPAREYSAQDLTWLASQYFVKSYGHLKRLRETREPQHVDMAKACCHRAAQLFLLAAATFQGRQVPSPFDELPPVDALILLLDGRLLFEAEAAVRSAPLTPADLYWRNVAQGLRARFERAEPALFTAEPAVMPSPAEDAPLPCPRGRSHVCVWRG